MLKVGDTLKQQYLITKKFPVESGFGNVFLARDSYRPSGRECVVKELRTDFKTPEKLVFARERFEKEAVILERLGDLAGGRIPKLYAYFSEGETFYLVQEFIDGVSRTGKRTEQEVRDLLGELLKTLEFIHSHDVIHRDIKPSNIVIRRSDGFPVLIDFGLIKEVTRKDYYDNPSKSVEVGTRGFTPPEQWDGFPVQASDLYSLGITALCWLTGQPTTRSIMRWTGANIVIKWDTLAPEVSAPMRDLLEKATAISCPDRFQTAAEFVSALRNGVTTNENNRKPLKVEETEEYKAAFEEAYQTGKDHALEGIGYYLELGFRGVINLRNADAGRTGEKAGWFEQGYREGFRKGYLAGGGAIVDENAFEPISWKNLKPGRKLYAAGRHEATVLFVEPATGLIYVEYLSGSVEYKRVSAVADFWSVKKAEVEIDPV